MAKKEMAPAGSPMNQSPMQLEVMDKPFKVQVITAIEKYGILAVLVLLMTFFSFQSDAFLTGENLLNILRQISMLGIVAIGMTFVMLTAGIDLSVGSLYALSGVIVAVFVIELGMPVWLAIPLTVVISGIVGFINAFIVNQFKIPPLIATLGTMTILRGVAYIITGGLPVFGFPQSFNFLGQGYVLGIPVPVIILAVLFVLIWIFLNKTYIGRYFYAIGGNEEATYLSGVNVKKIKYLVYILCAALTGIAGIIVSSRMSSGQPSVGTGFELDVVTAVVLGGVSFLGGEGKLSGMLIGVLIMGVLSNGLILLNVDAYYQWVIKGAVLLAAVGFDRWTKETKSSI